MSERTIWTAMARHPEAIGYPDGRVLHDLQLGSGAGYADLVVLPAPKTGGRHRIAIVEAKRIKNEEAAAKVVGQLLKYYSHARRLGSNGLSELWAAADRPECKRWTGRLSAAKALGCAKAEAYERLQRGETKLEAGEVGLHIALDGESAGSRKRLGLIVDTLARDHGLAIKVWVVQGGRVRAARDDDRE